MTESDRNDGYNSPNIKTAQLNGKITVNLIPVFLLVLLLDLWKTYHTMHHRQTLQARIQQQYFLQAGRPT